MGGKKAWDPRVKRGAYYYTIVADQPRIRLWNVGLGAFIGCEFDKQTECRNHLYCRPKLETELEVLRSPRIAGACTAILKSILSVNKFLLLNLIPSSYESFSHFSRCSVCRLIALYQVQIRFLDWRWLCLCRAGIFKKLISNHERTKEAIITYLVALITWLLIWRLIWEFTDVLLLVGLAAGLSLVVLQQAHSQEVERRPARNREEKKEDGAPAASVGRRSST